ncbi:MAG TPA: hypothetical protein PK149_07960 [Flavobacteriales bacterium]|nr:hypothetical protein [Flavobacteriales bacterium]
MENALPHLDTPVASIIYTSHDRVEVHFKPGVRFTPEGVAELMKSRQLLGASGKHRVLMLLPEEIQFDPRMVSTDHYGNVPQPNTEAVAWVVHNIGDAQITKIVLSRSHVSFPWKVFLDEQEARNWLDSVTHPVIAE